MTPLGTASREMRKVAVLYPHFLSGYFHIETASGQLESGLSVGHMFAFLAVPGVFASGFALMKTGALLAKPVQEVVISSLDDKLVLIVLSIVVAGVVSVLNMHKLLPSDAQRDTLATLPVSRSVLVAARVAAYLSFVFLFCIDLNAVSAFVYPVTNVPVDASVKTLVQFFFAHLAVMTTCVLFSVMFFSGLYGLIKTLLPSAVPVFELMSIAILVAFLCVGPVSLRQIQALPAIARWNPALWFLGLYQMLLPAGVISRQLVTFLGFSALAKMAVEATLFCFVGGSGLVIVACLQNESRKEKSQLQRPGFTANLTRSLAALLFRLIPPGVARGTSRFMWATLLRVHECQLAVAVFAGLGVGLILNQLVATPTQGVSFVVPLVLTFVLVTGLVSVIRMPVQLDARLPFELSPKVEVGSVQHGLRRSILLFGLLPTLLLLLPAYGRNGYLSASGFLLYCGLLGALLLELTIWHVDFMPFAYEETVAKQNLPLILLWYAVAMAVYGFSLGRLGEWLSRSGRLALANIVLAGIYAAVRVYRRANRNNNPVRFTEVDQEGVQLLNI